MSKKAIILPPDYADWLASVKQRIAGARQRALLSANAEQIRLYHEIGRDILDRQSREKWGAKVIDHLSADLRAAFPDMKGLSSTNLKYMRVFAKECPNRLFVHQTAAQIPALPIGQQSAAQLSAPPQIGQPTADQLPWFHIVTLLTKLSDPALREWYALSGIDKPIGVADYQLVDSQGATEGTVKNLAAEAIAKGGQALSPRGELHTTENIGQRLNMRDFMDTMRASGMQTGGPPPLSQTDRQNFANHLDSILTRGLKAP